ncbi:MAG TPA: hypothetical protein VIV11_06865 [Kofleriaceae bacterium]
MRAAFVILCLAVACDAGEKPAPPAPTPATPPPKAVAPTPTDHLRYLPADSDFVIQIDVAALRKAKLWANHSKDLSRLIVPGFAECNYDPLAKMSTVSIGIPTKTSFGVIVVRGLDQREILTCLRTSKLKTKTSVKFDSDDVVTLSTTTGDTYQLTFADATTMVMQGPKLPAHSVDQTVQSGAPLAKNAAFVAAQDKVLRTAPISFVSRPDSKELGDSWAQMGLRPKAFSGTIRASDQLALSVVLVLQSDDAATQFANMLETQLKTFRSMAERAEARAQGDTVTIDVGMSETQVKSLVSMIAGMMPAQP